jgi:hypothetical protein
MKKFLFASFLFLVGNGLYSEQREHFLIGFSWGSSRAIQEKHDISTLRFGKHRDFNLQFYFSRYFGIRLERIGQDKEFSYVTSSPYGGFREVSEVETFLIIDLVFKIPIRFFSPYIFIGGGNRSFYWLPWYGNSWVGRAGVGVKIHLIRFLTFYPKGFFNINIGYSYFSNYRDVINGMDIHNNRKQSFHYGFEIGF